MLRFKQFSRCLGRPNGGFVDFWRTPPNATGLRRLRNRLPGVKSFFGQLMLFQRVPEVEDRRLVWNLVIAKLDPCQPAHRLAVVQAFLRHRIA